MAYLEETRSRSSAEPLNLKEAGQLEQWLASAQNLSLLILLGILGGWELAVALHWIDALFFPAPSTIVRTLGEGLLDGSMLTHTMVTLSRLGAGLLLGGSAGLIVGLVMGWSRRLCAVLDPFVGALYPMPKIALLPLVMILFGIGESSKIVLVAVSSFFPMLINTLAGVQQIAPIHWQVAANYGASRWKLVSRVLIPGSLPLLLTGTRIAFNTALIVTLSVELLTTQTGLGSLIWFAWQTMRLRQLYATLVVIALLGYGFNLLLTRLSAYLVPWQNPRTQ